MNPKKLDQIFARYIEKFEMLNDDNDGEIYKWRIVPKFRSAMDAALAAPDHALGDRLADIRKLTSNLIDNGKEAHLYALCEYAKEDAGKVRSILRALFSDDGGDLRKRQERIFRFLEECAELKTKYAPGNWRYDINLKTAIVLLFLYAPEDNYMYKSTQAHAFADCVGFLDDWGAGTSYRLDIYYRMCDELVAHIKQHSALKNTNLSRYDVDDYLYSDPEYHLLASDIIYCCSVYNLLDGIPAEHATTAEKRLAKERREKAEELQAQLLEAQENQEILDKAKQYILQTMVSGTLMRHKDKNLGDGIVEKVENLVWSNREFFYISVFFPNKEKKLQFMLKSLADGTIAVADTEISEKLAEYAPVLLNEQQIVNAVTAAEKKFAPYKDYLN